MLQLKHHVFLFPSFVILKDREGRDVLAHPRHLLVAAGLLHSLLLLLLFVVCYRDSAVRHHLGDTMYLFE